VDLRAATISAGLEHSMANSVDNCQEGASFRVKYGSYANSFQLQEMRLVTAADLQQMRGTWK
jgi:hypothetical protein